jgi:hypothetical protein
MVRYDSCKGAHQFDDGERKISNTKHGAHFDRNTLEISSTPDHTVPYGTVFFCGSLSQALRAKLRSLLSLRDISQQRALGSTMRKRPRTKDEDEKD